MDRIIMEKKLEKIRDFANIPSSFKDLTVNSFRTDIYSGDSRLVAEYVKAVSIRYIRNFQKAVELGKGLYFYSRLPGSGKTRMAISIGNALMNLYGKGVKYMTVEELLTEIKSSFKDRNVSEKDLQSVAKMVDVLILDDLGVEKISPYSESVLYSIIDHRNDEGKISIFTANQSIENLAYHNRIKSRIGRMAVEIHFPEESIRQEVARSENQDFLDQLLKDS